MARQGGAPAQQLQLAGLSLGQQTPEIPLLRRAWRLQLRPEPTAMVILMAVPCMDAGAVLGGSARCAVAPTRAPRRPQAIKKARR
jgi:hypothetical protein